MSSEHQGLAVLREVTELLGQIGVKYWLGRGRFRHFVVTHEFGDEASDIDIHVFRADEAALAAAIPALRSRGYSVTAHERHKLSIRRGTIDLEFVFLDPAGADGLLAVHETRYPKRKQFTCPRDVFGENILDICGLAVRVPSDEYLPNVFGPRWRDDRKGSGGVELP